MAVSFDGNIQVNITLAAAPLQAAGFGTVALVATDQSFGSSSRGLLLTSAGAAEAALTAGDITAAVRDAALVAFSQIPRPASFLVINRDSTVGSETYTQALAAADLAGLSYYGVCIDSRADADILEASATIEASSKILAVQSDDADWLTASLPSGLSALAGRERTALVYSDLDTPWYDVAWLTSRLGFNPDVQTQSFEGQIRGVAAYVTPPTAGEQVLALANNVNLVGSYGSAPTYIDPGKNLAGRSWTELLTLDWFEARLSERLTTLKLNYDAAGLIIPVDLEGYNIVRGEVEAQFEQGVSVGKFRPEQTRVDDPTAASFDEGAQRITVTGAAQLTTSARLFEVNLNFARTEVN